jgi:hypothetical protein
LGADRFAIEPDDALDFAAIKKMDDGGAVEIVSLAKFESAEGVAKGCGLVEVGCPFIHIPEEEAGFDIFQNSFHFAVGVIIVAFSFSQIGPT